MKIYLICPVRNATPEILNDMFDYVTILRKNGYEVHYPPEDAPQHDPVGNLICETHLSAMKNCDQVHVYWDVDSKGSHFDLGMAYALGKTIIPIATIKSDGPEKSYWKVMKYWNKK